MTVVIVVLAVFVGQRVLTHMDLRQQATTSVSLEDQQGADAWIQGFTYHQTHSGATKWVVTASQAKVFEEKHLAKLQAVKVQLFDKEFQKEQVVITSEEGLMNTTSHDFDLVSQDEKTVMTFESGYQVFADRLKWKEEARQIRTEDSVVIRGEGLTITGNGLIGDVDRNEFQLLNNVRAEMSSP